MADLKRILQLATRPETGRLGDEKTKPNPEHILRVATRAETSQMGGALGLMGAIGPVSSATPGDAPNLIESLRAFSRSTTIQIRVCHLTLVTLGLLLVFGDASWPIRIGVLVVAALVAVYARAKEKSRARADLLVHIIRDLDPQAANTVATIAAEFPSR